MRDDGVRIPTTRDIRHIYITEVFCVWLILYHNDGYMNSHMQNNPPIMAIRMQKKTPMKKNGKTMKDYTRVI